MLHTISAPFDHHSPRGGRGAFIRFASDLARRFAQPPQVIDDTIFTYTKSGISQLDRALSIDFSAPAIIYLSNIVMHSAVLVAGDCDCHDLHAPIEYDSFESFRAHPRVRGHYYNEGDLANARFDESTIVISDFGQFRCPARGPDGLDPALFEVLVESPEEVGACRIRDYARYFQGVYIDGGQAYFLPSASEAELKKWVKHYARQTLTSHLMNKGKDFATLNDCHMDDSIVVSYGQDFWRLGGDSIAFVR